MRVDAEVVQRESQRREARDADHVAGLGADRRPHDRDLLAVANAVAELVEHVGNQVRVTGGGIERQRDQFVAVTSPYAGRDDDQIVAGVESCDLHRKINGTPGDRMRPVKK